MEVGGLERNLRGARLMDHQVEYPEMQKEN